MDTATIHGLEILSVGTWDGMGCPVGGCEFTHAHLDKAVEFLVSNPNHRAPVKLGHGTQSILKSGGMPAAGYITKLWRQGDKLLADIEDVPARLAELFKRGAWRNRSAELSWINDEEGNPTQVKITGLALLGSVIPAVQNLADIEALYTRLSMSVDDGSVAVMFEAKDEPQLSPADEALVLLEDYFNGRTDGPDLRALARVFTARRHEVDDTKIRAALGLGEDASEDDVIAEVAKLKTPVVDSVDATMSKANIELNARVVALETQLAQREAIELVESAIRQGKLVPASRESSMKFALSSPEGFKAFIEAQPKIVDLGEKGSSEGGTPDEFEPTETEIELGRLHGNTANDIKIQKMRDAGKTVSDALLKTQREEHASVSA